MPGRLPYRPRHSLPARGTRLQIQIIPRVSTNFFSSGRNRSLPKAMTAATMPSMRSVLLFLLGLSLPAASVSTATPRP